MGIFDFFKAKKGNDVNVQNNQPKADKPKVAAVIAKNLLGPTYLNGFTAPYSMPKKVEKFEWLGQLRLPSGQSQFKIKFYGKRHQQHSNLIVGTDFAPALVMAVDESTGQEILLFDGCKHGYNAMFCDTYSVEQINNRTVDQYYTDKEGNDSFEIGISAYYQIDYDDESEGFVQELDENEMLELPNGRKIEFETVKRDGFDVYQIFAIDFAGKKMEILSEELS
jgi:hypothetical protein